MIKPDSLSNIQYDDVEHILPQPESFPDGEEIKMGEYYKIIPICHDKYPIKIYIARREELQHNPFKDALKTFKEKQT